MRERRRFAPVFLCYLAVLFRITVFRSGFGTHPAFGGSVNAALFTGYSAMLAAGRWRSFVYLFFGNILWFVPFGFFLRRRCRLSRTVALGFLLSLCIESLQFVFATGVSEPDDLILNTAGALLGALAAGRTPRLRGKKAQSADRSEFMSA